MKTKPKIVNTGKKQPKIDQSDVAKALGAELVGEVPAGSGFFGALQTVANRPRSKIDKKTEPTFGFIGRDGNERLYKLEDRVTLAITHLAEFRENQYDEDKWSCALPEAMAAALDSFQRDHVEPAVLHWIEEQLNPRLQRFRPGRTDWELFDKLTVLLERIKAENERPEPPIKE